ncbi:MAG: hypothetical protein H6Q75_1029 [Firmicutes bacterium]|nr:hypothetical protein [Bacillota bacterium]
MYKLIIGNVRISVYDDNVSREQAAAMARQTLQEAHRQGKILSHIEITSGDYGPEINTTEKSGYRAATRKTIKQSLLDAIYDAAREKLYPSNAYSSPNTWFDTDTGQEWYGETVDTAREEIMQELEKWQKNLSSP